MAEGLERLVSRLLEGCPRGASCDRAVSLRLYRVELTGGPHKDWLLLKETYERDIPELLREVLWRLGLDCDVYVNPEASPTYLLNCWRGERPYAALAFDVEVDRETGDVLLKRLHARKGALWSREELAEHRLAGSFADLED